MSEAARKPATAQMMTFWKNVACTTRFSSTEGARTREFTPQIRFSGMGVADFLSVMPSPVQFRPKLEEAEQLVRLLELELMQKRADWKQASQRSRSIRSAAFLFLFLLVAGCLLASFLAFNRVSEKRSGHPATASQH
jgi:hypothetical protein